MSDLSKEADGDKTLQTTESITPLPSISETDRELAQAALQEFEQGNNGSCLSHLKSLLSNRPQDVKVFHNIYVTEYYLSNCKDTDTFLKNLQEVLKQVHAMSDNIEILEVDHCVLFYNQAVLLYHLNQHSTAINILDKVFQFIEPLDEVFAKKVCFLLLELYLSTFQPKKAHSLIGYMETMLFVSSKSNQNGKSNEKDTNKEDNKDSKENGSYTDILKPRLQQYKARCYAMMKTAKACKREIKGLMSSSTSLVQNILAFYLKSQLEYQRGNYRKALKILSSATIPENVNKFFSKTGNCLPTMFYNNVGCIHFCMGKPHLGSLYFGKALQEYENNLKNASNGSICQSSSRSLHNICLTLRYSLLYNMGVQHLYSGNFQKAFICLTEVVKVYHKNPRLLLRLAECCIHIYKSDGNFPASQIRKNLVQNIVGSGLHRKITLASSVSKDCLSIGSIANDSMATLEFASMCLCNALNLLPEETSIVSVVETSSPTHKTNEESDGNQTQEINYVQALPSSPVQGIELSSLRNSILVSSSYVSLCLGDINVAHKFAEKLLSQPKLSGVHRYLGHLYAGESLILMDRITEAIEHLKPEHATDITLMFPVTVDETKNSDKVEETNKSNTLHTQNWYPNSLSTAKVIFQFNMTVAYTLREEWEKANDCLRQIFAAKNQDTEIPAQAYMLAIYIKLQQGFADKAKGFVKQYLPQYR